MRKIISVIIMIIFLLSILPLTFAIEENTNSDNNNYVTKGVRENIKERKEESEKLREKLRVIEERRIERLKELREKPELAKYNNTLSYKARIIGKMQVEKAKENYIRAKERYELAKTSLEQAKLRFQEQITLRKACKGNITDCNQTEEQLKLRAKEFLGNSADAIIEHLNRVKGKIQENEDLSEEEANIMISKIDAKIAEIEAAKKQAQEATTKEGIVEAAKKINAAWKDIKVAVGLHTSAMVNAKIGGIIVKSNNLKEKLEKILARMEENGKNVDEIKPMITEYETKIKIAQEKYQGAVSKYKEAWLAEGKSEAKQKLEEARILINEAKEALKEANEKLREIIKAIKEKNGEQEIEEENEGESSENETSS